MLNLLTSEGARAAQAIMLGGGLTTFLYLMLHEHYPLCTWFEWVTRPPAAGDQSP